MQHNRTIYHRKLSDYFSEQTLFFDGDLQKKPNIRKCVEQPYQQTKAELWDEVTDTLCNLNFIQANACTKMTYDLFRDFNEVLESIPDNAENMKQEKLRQSRMEKYAKDLIAYADEEIKELGIPETVPVSNEEEINVEFKRSQTNLTRLDRLKDFVNFLGQEAWIINSDAYEFPYFTLQIAWNYAKSGPVGNAAINGSAEVYSTFLLRNPSTRPPWNPIPQIIQILRGHTAKVTSVSITPDGKRAISGSEDYTCIIWDLTNGKSIHTLRGHTLLVSAICITPDGSLALSGSYDGTIILWNINTGKSIKILRKRTGFVTTVSITPDGKMALAVYGDNTFILWDLSTGKSVQIFKGHTDFIRTVSITPDGKRALSCSDDKTCILWDPATGEALRTLRGHNDSVNAVSITPDGRRALSCSEDKTCILWNLNTGIPLQKFFGHAKLVNAASITPDGTRALTISEDKTGILWDLTTSRKLSRFHANTEIISGAVFDNGFVLGCSNGEVVILNAKKENLCPSFAITTIRHLWNFEQQKYQNLSTDCPLCGNRFAPPIYVLKLIDNLVRVTGLKPEQSPCLELPDEAWDDPGLISNCPNCGVALKFNPFIAGGDNLSR